MDEDITHIVVNAVAVPLGNSGGEPSSRGTSRLVDDLDTANWLITAPPHKRSRTVEEVCPHDHPVGCAYFNCLKPNPPSPWLPPLLLPPSYIPHHPQPACPCAQPPTGKVAGQGG